MLKELTDITKDDFENDWKLIKFICDKNASFNVKEQIIKKYAKRINNFNDIQTIYFLTSISTELCEKCEEFIKNRIETLNKEVLAKIFSQDGKGIILTNIANYLVKQDWFNYKEQYQKYIIAYNLIKDNNDNDKLISNEEIYEYGEYILNMLNESICDVDIMNIILKNYLELVKKYYPNYFNFFMARGYKIIDKYLTKDTILNRNIMMFDCYITSYLYDIKSFYGVYFNYEDIKDSTYAYYENNTVTINYNSVVNVYNNSEIQEASLYLLYALSHEMVHADQDNYIKGLKQSNDSYSKLRLHNFLFSFYLRSGVEELYDENHNCFYKEYDALIRGLEMLYKKLNFFSNFEKSSIEEFNKIMACEILNSYYDLIDSGSLLSPVQFTRSNYNLNKDKLFDKMEILISNSEIEEIENNLTDYEKFILGYDNPYLEVIDNIINGNSCFLSTNLTLDIPKLYDEYNTLLGKNYEFLKDESYIEDKKKIIK